MGEDAFFQLPSLKIESILKQSHYYLETPFEQGIIKDSYPPITYLSKCFPNLWNDSIVVDKGIENIILIIIRFSNI